DRREIDRVGRGPEIAGVLARCAEKKLSGAEIEFISAAFAGDLCERRDRTSPAFQTSRVAVTDSIDVKIEMPARAPIEAELNLANRDVAFTLAAGVKSSERAPRP